MVKSAFTETSEEKIITAAKAVFLAKGLAGARMKDIAEAAGINKALLHYYFRSKEKLFEHIFTEIAGAFLPRVIGIISADVSIFEKIEMFCREYISQVIETPYVPIFILNEINRQPDAFLKKMFAGRELPFGIFLKQFSQEVSEEKIKPVDPLQVFLNIMSLCVFPFAAKPIIEMMSGKGNDGFEALMEERKTEIPKMIIASIKK